MRPIKPFTPYALARDWGEEIIVAHTEHYLGKVLKMKAGTRGGLQQHRVKDETFFLFSGKAVVRSDDGAGKLISVEMFEGQSYHIPPGATHQVEAITDCVFIEASTPHFDDRVRVEKSYGIQDDGGLPTTDGPRTVRFGLSLSVAYEIP